MLDVRQLLEYYYKIDSPEACFSEQIRALLIALPLPENNGSCSARISASPKSGFGIMVHRRELFCPGKLQRYPKTSLGNRFKSSIEPRVGCRDSFAS